MHIGSRRLIVVTAGVAVVAALASGCGSDDGSGADGDSQATKQVKVAYVIPSLNNEAFKTEVDSAGAAAKADGHVDYKVHAGTNDTDVTAEIALLRAALAQAPDAIIIHVDDAKAMRNPLKLAVKQSKVIAVGQPIPGVNTSSVQFPDLNGGKVAGKFLAEHVEDGAEIGILSCFPGQYRSIEDRVNGAKSQWSGKNYKIVATLDAQCDASKGRAAMAALLTSHPDVDAVFSVSDSQTAGAVSAMKQAGKRPFLVSYDAQPTIVQLVKKGVVDGTVDINTAKGGETALGLAASAARGQKHPKNVNIPSRIVTKENADQVLAGE
jgi:ribose transport system substrate-binding protein